MARKRKDEDCAALKLIGSRIQDYRKAAGVTQQQVADHIGIAQSNYAKFERGNMGLNIESISKIADFFKVDLNIVFTGREYKSKKNDLIDISFVPGDKRAKFQYVVEELMALLKED